MPDPLEIRLDDDGSHIVDPPIVDMLCHDVDKKAYFISLVPSEDLSTSPTESVTVGQDSVDGQQIQAWLGEISSLLCKGKPIQRLVHGGGGDFTFHFQGGTCYDLSDERFDQEITQRVYDGLQAMAMSAENVLRMEGIKHQPMLLRVEDVKLRSQYQARLLTLCNSARSNSLAERLMQELTISIRQAPEAIIVLKSEGKNFCGGLDLWELLWALKEEKSPQRLLQPLIGLFKALAEHERPTVSLVRGHAVAGGVGLACIADVVVAHRDAIFRIPGEEGYRALAAVLIPILNQRRQADAAAIDDWFGQEFGAAKAQEWQLVNDTSTSADEEVMLELALTKLEKKGLLDTGSSIASTRSKQCIEQIDQAYQQALKAEAVEAIWDEVLAWSTGKTPPRR